MRGISLVETVVVIAITAMVAGSLLSAIRYFYVNNAYVFEAASSVDSARRGIATALSDLREASYADDGAYPLGSVATSSITFYSDVDADGGVERVKIWRVSNTLYKVVTNASGNPPSYTGGGSSTTTIATYLRNATSTPLFAYYDANGTKLSTTSTPIASIATVAMTIQIDLNPNRAPNVFTLTGSATMRNLRDE
ncbi:MAG TPA: hypothetical protein PK109_02175 [Candidatus Paceibacterota bacterium]|nr:hypothetical protein [Candidatus Paceibacterota bacterium]